MWWWPSYKPHTCSIFRRGAQGPCEILPCEHLSVVDVGEGHAPGQIRGSSGGDPNGNGARAAQVLQTGTSGGMPMRGGLLCEQQPTKYPLGIWHLGLKVLEPGGKSRSQAGLLLPSGCLWAAPPRAWDAGARSP